MDIKTFLKNKFLVTAMAISAGILILVLLISPKKNVNPVIPSPSSSSSSLSNIIPTDLSQERRNQIIIYTNEIENKLPLTVESLNTSVNIETYINISRTDSDPAEIVRLDIAGISYINKNELDETKNPNLTAFKESYLKAIELLESQNIDPKRLHFVYSDVPYVRETATYWIDTLGLLK